MIPSPKGKGKENVAYINGHGARKHRDDISATPLNTSPRSLPFRDPVISAVFSDMDIRRQARTEGSPSSLVSMTKDTSQIEVLSQSSTRTSFEIGLAMLTDPASPNDGLRLDVSPCPASPEHISSREVSQSAESLINASMKRMGREAALSHLQHSVTAGSKGLAYLSDSDSPEMMLPDKPSDEYLDIATALAVYKTQKAGDRLKAEKDQAEQKTEQHRGNEIQDFPASSSCELEARYASSEATAPTLPTLSEMTLSRANPLDKSITNDLFASYSMRMSTATGSGRPSRVSARISRMLSWFAETDSGNTSSRISGSVSWEESNFAAEGDKQRMSSISSPASVQPLRIGKVSIKRRVGACHF
ncbi:hypothetical protein JB92DRAFT_3053440 [Gautieria morchelliformis]|nr:hypothetical protein JB92DRAFT_3053440 [Gautieria morchelliformis]